MTIAKLYDDAACAVIDKPAGILTHRINPADKSDTVASWWVNQPAVDKSGWEVGREGIVHRLDRDTSGAMMLAKAPAAQDVLRKQFHDRTVKKQYLALCFGAPERERGEITSRVARDSKRRTKRTSRLISFDDNTREAISEYRVIKTGNINGTVISIVNFAIKTGRTHQVRLHAKMLGTPILGDSDYGTKPSRRASSALGVTRQMLHSKRLSFTSPATKREVDIRAPLPDDIEKQIDRISSSGS